MRIEGQWFECDDSLIRPVVRGEILDSKECWEPTFFLVDTGADRTVLTAALLDILGIAASATVAQLGGVGGVAPSVEIATRIRLPCDDGGAAIFRGQFAALTQLESLDICILGRDILRMFAVIIDQPGNIVTLVRAEHRYAIES